MTPDRTAERRDVLALADQHLSAIATAARHGRLSEAEAVTVANILTAFRGIIAGGLHEGMGEGR